MNKANLVILKENDTCGFFFIDDASFSLIENLYKKIEGEPNQLKMNEFLDFATELAMNEQNQIKPSFFTKTFNLELVSFPEVKKIIILPFV